MGARTRQKKREGKVQKNSFKCTRTWAQTERGTQKWERDGHRGREKETGKVKTTRKASKARATCGCKKGA